MADSPDVAVDVLRKRARRRLVGAILLALIAAVVLPVFLESDPKPLGQDVAIQIPPIEGGKFTATRPPLAVTGVDAPRAEPPKPEAAGVDAAKSEVSKAEASTSGVSKSEVSKAEVSKAEAMKSEPPSSGQGTVPTPGAQTPGAAAKPVDAGTPKAAAAAATGTPAAGTFAVQVGALAEIKKANEMAGKLRAAGHPVYVSEVATASGVVYRVRVPGFATRDAAQAALPRLRDQGYPGIVAEVK